MSEPTQYPRRLYMGGLVIDGDLHATNSVVVADAEQEAEARAKGYRTAFDSGGNGGSPEPVSPSGSTSDELNPTQGDVAVSSADPDEAEEIGDDVDDIEALRAQLVDAGVRVDRRWKEDRLRAELAKVGG